jgi:hypothetical protein
VLEVALVILYLVGLSSEGNTKIPDATLSTTEYRNSPTSPLLEAEKLSKFAYGINTPPEPPRVVYVKLGKNLVGNPDAAAKAIIYLLIRD